MPLHAFTSSMPPLTLLIPSQWMRGISHADALDLASVDHFETMLLTLTLPRSITPLVQPRYQDTSTNPLRTKSIAAALNHAVHGELPKTSLLVLDTTNIMLVTSCAAQHPQDHGEPRKGWPAAHNWEERFNLTVRPYHEGFLDPNHLSVPIPTGTPFHELPLHFNLDFVEESHEIVASLGASVPTTLALLTCPPSDLSHIKFLKGVGDFFTIDPFCALTPALYLILNIFAGLPPEITAQDLSLIHI